MHDQQGGEQQGAAGEVARGEALMEDQVAGEGGEDGFETHDNRRVSGGGGTLADDLQGEGNASREDAGVEDGKRGRAGGPEG